MSHVLTCCLFGFDSISMSLITSLLNREREFPCRATALHRNTGPRRHCPPVAVSVSPLPHPGFRTVPFSGEWKVNTLFSLVMFRFPIHGLVVLRKKIRVTTYSDLPIRSVSTIISDYLTLFKERHALAFIPYNCLSLKTVSDEDCRWRTIATSKWFMFCQEQLTAKIQRKVEIFII